MCDEFTRESVGGPVGRSIGSGVAGGRESNTEAADQPARTALGPRAHPSRPAKDGDLRLPHLARRGQEPEHHPPGRGGGARSPGLIGLRVSRGHGPWADDRVEPAAQPLGPLDDPDQPTL